MGEPPEVVPVKNAVAVVPPLTFWNVSSNWLYPDGRVRAMLLGLPEITVCEMSFLKAPPVLTCTEVALSARATIPYVDGVVDSAPLNWR
jgi:hypothetical protein